MPARISGRVHQARRIQQGNVAAFEAGGGTIQKIKMPKKQGARGGQGGQSKQKKKARELNDQLKSL